MEVDALEFAMQREKDAQIFYRELSNSTKDKGLKAILTKLSEVEVKHYEILKELKEESGSTTTVVMDEDNYRGAFKTLFTDLSDQIQETNLDVSEVEMYRNALNREEEAARLYATWSAEAEDEASKALFDALAKQEKLHYDIIDSVIEYLARAEPGGWLENAEWYHHDEY